MTAPKCTRCGKCCILPDGKPCPRLTGIRGRAMHYKANFREDDFPDIPEDEDFFEHETEEDDELDYDVKLDLNKRKSPLWKREKDKVKPLTEF